MSLEADFQTAFGQPPEAVIFVPGRVNLIGEHTDYNGGLVMPMGLPLGIRLALSRRPDRRLLAVSTDFADQADRSLDDTASGHWSDHLVGALAIGGSEAGANIALHSNLPLGSGLSSSAATIVGLLKAIHEVEGRMVPPDDIALTAQRVETEHVGVPCGIMDQMAVVHLGANECMRLNTDTLARQPYAVPDGWSFAVHHSGVHRRLAEGRYGQRRQECVQAAQALGVDLLCQLEDPYAARHLPQPLGARARHVIGENNRVKAAEAALIAGDMMAFAELMNASHASLRDDFDVSTPEVDQVVDASRASGAPGARMTGGGFGGCIVSLLPTERVEDWKSAMVEAAPNARFIC